MNLFKKSLVVIVGLILISLFTGALIVNIQDNGTGGINVPATNTTNYFGGSLNLGGSISAMNLNLIGSGTLNGTNLLTNVVGQASTIMLVGVNSSGQEVAVNTNALPYATSGGGGLPSGATTFMAPWGINTNANGFLFLTNTASALSVEVGTNGSITNLAASTIDVTNSTFIVSNVIASKIISPGVLPSSIALVSPTEIAFAVNASTTYLIQNGSIQTFEPNNSGDLSFGTVFSLCGQSFFTSLVSGNIQTDGTHTPASVTVGASPFVFVNPQPFNLECYVSGAAAYTLAKNGVTITSSLATDAYVVLQTNCSLTITYASTTPTLDTNAW